MPSDDAQVVDQCLHLGVAFCLVGAEDRRRMDRGDHHGCELRLDRHPTLFRDAEVAPEQRLCSRRAEADHHARFDHAELRLEPRSARGDLRPVRLRVDPSLPPRGPLEVLDDVRHVRLRPIDACLVHRLIEQAPSWADERLPFAVLAVARLLADEHHLRLAATLAEDGLRAGPPQVTPYSWPPLHAALAALRGEESAPPPIRPSERRYPIRRRRIPCRTPAVDFVWSPNKAAPGALASQGEATTCRVGRGLVILPKRLCRQKPFSATNRPRSARSGTRPDRGRSRGVSLPRERYRGAAPARSPAPSGARA